MAIRAPNLRSFTNILKNGLARQPSLFTAADSLAIAHDNSRTTTCAGRTTTTESGESFLVCPTHPMLNEHPQGHQAARSGCSVLYVRATRLFDELQVAHGDGSFARRLAALAKLDLLVIDDCAISPQIAARQRQRASRMN